MVQQPSGGKAGPGTPRQVVGPQPLGRPHRGGVPLLALVVVHRHEGRLAAHGQPHVLGDDVLVDPFAQRGQPLPGLVRERQRDPRHLVDPGHAHVEGEVDLRIADHAGDGRGRAVVRRCRQRQVALAAEQAGGRVHADPARAGDVDLGPGMQVGEVVVGPRGAVQRLQVVLQLDQVAGHEPRRETEPAQDLHQQPAAVAARALAQPQRLVRCVDARLEADDIADVGLQPLVDRDEEIDDRRRLARHRRDEGVQQRPVLLPFQVGRELMLELGRIGEREGLRIVLDEEVERVDDRELRDEVDLDLQLGRRLGEDEPCQPVAVRILLPVDEMVLGRDLQ